MHCYNSHFIARLGERIGRPLKVDMNTLGDQLAKQSRVERGRYARLCVELDLQKQLVPRFIAAGQIYNVEYEGINLIYFECGRYGHRKENCPHRISASHARGEEKQEPQTTMMPERRQGKPNLPPEEPFGPWMFVSKATKSRVSMRGGQRVDQKSAGSNQKKEKNETIPSNQSRFAALEKYGAEDAAGLQEQGPRNSMEKGSISEIQKGTEKAESGRENRGNLSQGSMLRGGKKPEQLGTVKDVSRYQIHNNRKAASQSDQARGRMGQHKPKQVQALMGRKEGGEAKMDKPKQNKDAMGRRESEGINKEQPKL